MLRVWKTTLPDGTSRTNEYYLSGEGRKPRNMARRIIRWGVRLRRSGAQDDDDQLDELCDFGGGACYHLEL